MPKNDWGTPLRDVLSDPEVALQTSDLNAKFLAFYRADGEAYSPPYNAINTHLTEPLSGNRVETWKKLFDTVGLLYVDKGAIRLTKFGRLFGGQWEQLRQHAAGARKIIARSAVGVLGRYQLVNPTTLNRGYPSDCDVFPYRIIWMALLRFGDLHWEELHRVLLRVMKSSELEAAFNQIDLARANPAYDPQIPSSAEKHLGPPIYQDPNQSTRRMTPWFSVAGFGGILIDKEAHNGRRKLIPEFRPFIEEEVALDRPWLEFGSDEEAWFAHLDSGVKDQTIVPNEFVPSISDDDPIYKAVVELVIEDGTGGALLVGPPGTGKSWYARQIAHKLTGGDTARVREVQFHPSYQYEDFVEGYVPDGQSGFRLADKHLLEMIEVAKDANGPVVILIDEFSRTDPARVLGETMTYMEGSLRGVDFYLPSGRKTNIPKNLIFIATMNPEDRSVDEIDAAMDRRWAKITLSPDPKKVSDFLTKNECPKVLRTPIIEFFTGVQAHFPLGHAFFRTVNGGASLRRLWDTQLRHVAIKRFRFDPGSMQEIDALWATCAESVKQLENLSAQVAEPAIEKLATDNLDPAPQ